MLSSSVQLTITGEVTDLGKGNIGDYIGRSHCKFQTFTQKNYLTQFFFVHLIHVVAISIGTDVVYTIAWILGVNNVYHEV